jgi:hypothetical protein
MQRNFLVIAISGIIVIGAVTYFGYFLGNNVGKPKNTALNASPSPSTGPTDVPYVSPLPTLSPSPSPSVTPTTLPTAPPPKATVKAAATINSAQQSQEISVRFVDIPSSASLGENFNVGWYVSGPDGKMGTYTKVSTSRKVGTNDGASSSYTSTKTSQAFGEFRIPQKFVSTMNFSGDSGTVEIKAIAEIDGKIYTATRSIILN